MSRLQPDAESINDLHRIEHDIVHKGSNILANGINSVVEHVINHIGFQPLPKPFYNIELRAVSRQEDKA